MPNWKQMDQGLTVAEYAARVCRELGLPFTDNLKIFKECIESIAFTRETGPWEGFSILLEAAEEFRERTGKWPKRWWFIDGDYNNAAAAKKSPNSVAIPESKSRRLN